MREIITGIICFATIWGLAYYLIEPHQASTASTRVNINIRSVNNTQDNGGGLFLYNSSQQQQHVQFKYPIQLQNGTGA